MSRRLRVSAPPPAGALALWATQLTDEINALPAFSISSTSQGPNYSLISGDPTTLLFDVGSSSTKAWLKHSGSTTTGWKQLVLSPIAYGDLPNSSGTWALGSNKTITLQAILSVTSYFAANGLPPKPPQAYTPTNVTTDRAFDANATTLDEIADVLGTLISDLSNVGLLK